jgi:hypothetical protein
MMKIAMRVNQATRGWSDVAMSSSVSSTVRRGGSDRTDPNIDESRIPRKKTENDEAGCSQREARNDE